MSKVVRDMSFRDCLKALVDKYDYSISDVAELANTCTFVVHEWMRGTAIPTGKVRSEVLNSLDDPNTVRNHARGFLGVPSAWEFGHAH